MVPFLPHNISKCATHDTGKTAKFHITISKDTRGMLQGGSLCKPMSVSNNVFPFKCYFLQMADFPGDVSRICQHRADALMEICPELLKDNVVQKKKGGNKVF